MLSREWRCSWSSADRRCSNYIWVINKFVACWGATYISDLAVVIFTLLPCSIFHHSGVFLYCHLFSETRELMQVFGFYCFRNPENAVMLTSNQRHADICRVSSPWLPTRTPRHQTWLCYLQCRAGIGFLSVDDIWNRMPYNIWLITSWFLGTIPPHNRQSNNKIIITFKQRDILLSYVFSWHLNHLNID